MGRSNESDFNIAQWKGELDRLVVVDNSPSSERAAATDLICGHGNVGYGTAADLGVFSALASEPSSAWLVVVNSDAQPGRDFRALLAAENACDVLAINYVNPDGSPQRSKAPLPTARNAMRVAIRGEAWTTASADSTYPVGACIVMKLGSFRALGGFDPRFFLYFEETDLFVRAREAGMNFLDAVPGLVAVHDRDSTAGEYAELTGRELGRSAYLLAAKRGVRGVPWAVIWTASSVLLSLKHSLRDRDNARRTRSYVLGFVRAALTAGRSEPMVASALRAVPKAQREALVDEALRQNLS